MPMIILCGLLCPDAEAAACVPSNSFHPMLSDTCSSVCCLLVPANAAIAHPAGWISSFSAAFVACFIHSSVCPLAAQASLYPFGVGLILRAWKTGRMAWLKSPNPGADPSRICRVPTPSMPLSPTASLALPASLCSGMYLCARSLPLFPAACQDAVFVILP